LPSRARWYILAVIVLGAATVAVSVLVADVPRIPSLTFFIILSALTSAFKVQFPIATGTSMSVTYVVDIAALIVLGPHATMLVGAISGWVQSTFNQPPGKGNPRYRTLFNMAVLVLTIQAAGHVYLWLGGSPSVDLRTMGLALLAMTLTYFLVNTAFVALAVAFTTDQPVYRIWRSDF